MKSKIETTTPQQQDIDWGKVMLVKCTEADKVVMTTGEHDGTSFSGMCISGEEIEYSTRWRKSVFTPLPLPQTITFYE